MARGMANSLSSRLPAAAELQEAVVYRGSPQASADVCQREWLLSPPLTGLVTGVSLDML